MRLRDNTALKWLNMVGCTFLEIGLSTMGFSQSSFCKQSEGTEVHISPSVKGAALGVDGSQWESIYTKLTRGILAVHSKCGKPIHKVATQGVMLLKKFDDNVFKFPQMKRVAWLTECHDKFIGKLNKDFSRMGDGCRCSKSPWSYGLQRNCAENGLPHSSPMRCIGLIFTKELDGGLVASHRRLFFSC